VWCYRHDEGIYFAAIVGSQAVPVVQIRFAAVSGFDGELLCLDGGEGGLEFENFSQRRDEWFAGKIELFVYVLATIGLQEPQVDLGGIVMRWGLPVDDLVTCVCESLLHNAKTSQDRGMWFHETVVVEEAYLECCALDSSSMLIGATQRLAFDCVSPGNWYHIWIAKPWL
jgi:hypothetical protein